MARRRLALAPPPSGRQKRCRALPGAADILEVSATPDEDVLIVEVKYAGDAEAAPRPYGYRVELWVADGTPIPARETNDGWELSPPCEGGFCPKWDRGDVSMTGEWIRQNTLRLKFFELPRAPERLVAYTQAFDGGLTWCDKAVMEF